jgi:acyl carrier protein
MNEATLIDEVRQLVSEVVAQPLSPDMDDKDLVALAPDRYDSLGVLDCVGRTEQRFDISIDLVEDDLRTTFRSVSAIAALVSHNQDDLAVLRGEW